MSRKPLPRALTPAIVSELLNSIDYILLDVDGVLWAGDTIFDGVAETIAWLEQARGIKVRYMTNNASLSREQAAKKFRSRGLKTARPESIYSSAFVGALHIAHKLGDPATKKYHRNVFVVGASGLHQEVREILAPGYTTYGLELNSLPYDSSRIARSFDEKVLPAPSSADKSTATTVSLRELNFGTLIVGIDFAWNITKMAVASMILQQHSRVGAEKVHFVSTNRDPQIPIGQAGWLLPGAGSIVSSLVTVTEREPDVVCGKPEPPMLDLLLERENILDPRRCLMVGDRLTTDIAFGNGRGVQTLFVLSGAESMKDVEALASAPVEFANRHMPHFVADGLAELMRMGRAAKL